MGVKVNKVKHFIIEALTTIIIAALITIVLEAFVVDNGSFLLRPCILQSMPGIWF